MTSQTQSSYIKARPSSSEQGINDTVGPSTEGGIEDINIGQRGTENPAKKQKQKARRYDSLERYLRVCFQQRHPNINVSSKSMNALDTLLHSILARLAAVARDSALKDDRITLLPKDIALACNKVLPKRLEDQAVQNGRVACYKYEKAI